MIHLTPAELIAIKRDGGALSKQMIDDVVLGITDMSLSDAQVGAFAMAVRIRGMNIDETVQLTDAMRRSGTSITWSLDGPVVDKHSTGGVGDTVSLMLAPMLAVCGAFVPMISGRGLGHTGGTCDKMESIPGYTTTPPREQFQNIVRDVGCAVIGQTNDLAPADKRLYSIRDVTATVESIPLICSSILSKKLASGTNVLAMNVTTGGGAFMAKLEDAKALEAAGCFAIVLEKIPAELAAKVAAEVTIPIIGIGAGSGVDGQVLVVHDMLGINNDFSPRFLRKYHNLFEEMMDSFHRYIDDVRSGDFPNKEEQY